jgi:hypothetical protein
VKTPEIKHPINTRKKALALADALELEADKLQVCEANLGKHATLIDRAMNLRELASKMSK